MTATADSDSHHDSDGARNSATDGETATDTSAGDTATEPADEQDRESGSAAPDADRELTGPGRKLPVIALSVAVALVVAAATVAGWFGVAWVRASTDDGLAFSRTRDEVDRVARAAIVTMNTLDYRELDEGLADWADATTGELHDEITSFSEENKQRLRDAKSVTTAEVRSSAVKELDERAGRAVVIAALKRSVSTGGTSVDRYLRIECTLHRTDAGWKLVGIGPVSYAQPSQ